MNTTPTTSNADFGIDSHLDSGFDYGINAGIKGAIPPYTAVGGTERAASTGVSAVLLNRGGRYPRRILFKELEKAGFDYIISMEGPQERYDLEDLSGRFPFVRFIFLKEAVSPGETVNLAASELSSPLFFTLWNDQKLFESGGAARIAGLFLEDGPEGPQGRRLCTVPVIQNSRCEALPTMVKALDDRGKLRSLPVLPEHESENSLYPWDWAGVYDRRRFLRLGGFDREITAPYWQLMDFGFRAWLWGEAIGGTQHIRLVYDGELLPEDSTVDGSYRRFFLKNLAPVFRGDYAHLPLRSFPRCLARTNWDLVTAWNEFSRERRWVRENRSRFTCDARTLAALWEEG